MATERRQQKGVQPRPVGASLRSRIAPFLAMEVFKEAAGLAAQGRRIIRMEAGEPSTPVPRIVRETAIAALNAGRIGYTQSLGLPSLRARIARHYQEIYGVCVPAERVAVTTGSSGGFILAFLALFDPGARVAIAAPGYPAYRNILEAIGVEVVTIATSARDRHVVTAAMIEAEHAQRPLDGVLLMSPANPSGTMMSAATLREICEVCARLDIAFVSDEIYHGLTYGEPAQTALAFGDRAVVVNSFSKYYCMTGWRVGWLVLPEELVRPVELLAQNFAISPPTLSQIAAEAAFDAREDLEAIKAGYAKNRALLMEELPRIGLGDFHPVDGAFYVFADVSRFTNDSLDFCRRMLNEAGVAATPGVDFDREHGSSAVRFSFAGSHEDVVEGVKRLRDWLPRA
jgi:aspartate/methionine/tyrosine aminotransferase